MKRFEAAAILLDMKAGRKPKEVMACDVAVQALIGRETPETGISCNMLITDKNNRVCVVKDTCEGCSHDSEMCAIYDMLEQLGLIENWRSAARDLPTYRERIRRKETEA